MPPIPNSNTSGSNTYSSGSKPRPNVLEHAMTNAKDSVIHPFNKNNGANSSTSSGSGTTNTNGGIQNNTSNSSNNNQNPDSSAIVNGDDTLSSLKSPTGTQVSTSNAVNYINSGGPSSNRTQTVKSSVNNSSNSAIGSSSSTTTNQTDLETNNTTKNNTMTNNSSPSSSIISPSKLSQLGTGSLRQKPSALPTSLLKNTLSGIPRRNTTYNTTTSNATNSNNSSSYSPTNNSTQPLPEKSASIEKTIVENSK